MVKISVPQYCALVHTHWAPTGALGEAILSVWDIPHLTFKGSRSFKAKKGCFKRGTSKVSFKESFKESLKPASQ